MSRIRILPEILSNKIAAGEVVERPASVVKELAENAVDAGATRVLIDIEQGGRDLVQVADDGCGMSRDEALLSVERYATSKIATDEDLFRIRTLGFRGEALPSIAAVSRFTLVSRDAASEAGVAVRIDGGTLAEVAETGAPQGTLVTVRQLFFNTPARRKFMKAVSTEMAHITDTLAGMALAWPKVQFRLTHNGRLVKSFAAADPFERVTEVFGASLRADLLRLSPGQGGAVSVSGWIAHPRVNRRSSSGVFIFVNRRLVRDRLIQHALFAGCAQRLVKGQFPLAVLFVALPFEDVDVNVHPAKTEVRFARSKEVHEAVRRAVAQTLYEAARPQWGPASSGTATAPGAQGAVAEGGAEFGVRKAEGGIWEGGGEGGRRRAEGGIRSPAMERRTRDEDAGPAPGRDHRGGAPLPPGLHRSREPRPAPSSSGFEQAGAKAPPQSASRVQAVIWEKGGFAGLRVIGQLHATYILCEAPDGLVLVDQHAAHERVLYEQFGRGGAARGAAQALLVPETVALSHQEAESLTRLAPALAELGIAIEPFGGATVVVKAVPAALSGREMRPLLSEIAAAASAAAAAGGAQAALDRCRQIAACHGAIRAGQPLAAPQIQRLLEQLDGCANPSHCPHGRPTWLRYDRAVLERAFKRAV
jgi:DNA mismatch repair protein MutL